MSDHHSMPRCRDAAMPLLLAVALAGCSQVAEPPHSDRTEANVVRAYDPLVVARPYLQVGESCAGLRDACLSGYCLRTSPRNEDHFCTRKCTRDEPCPIDFTCTVFQGIPDSYCWPVSSWTSQVARPRPVASRRIEADAGFQRSPSIVLDGGSR